MKYWHESFTKLSAKQMLEAKFEEELSKHDDKAERKLERGTQPPTNDQVLELLWRFNKDKPARWL
jgi:hypothetical protein